MIDRKNHYARYCELISLAASSAPARQLRPRSPAGRRIHGRRLYPFRRQNAV